ncbi:MAG: sulfotransferase [Acidimicrobiales bacterium]
MNGSDAGSDSDERTTVLYITGSGRSGSTLLERILGACPGFVNVGELIELFRWVAPHNERCGCGQTFSSCPFWQAVGERAYGGWSPETVERIVVLQRRVARQRRLPQLLAHPHTGERFARDLAAYHDVYRRLYAAIRDEGHARIIVDASKWPAQGFALARAPGLDVRVLHLIRDVRGVAFSWAKAGVTRPHATPVHGSARTAVRANMATHPVSRTALRWSAFQTEAEVIGRVLPYHARMRYEDLVADPVGTIRETQARLGLPVDDSALGHLNDDGVTLEATHGLGGNPSRFRVGYQAFRLDETWRRSMERSDRWAASLVALPALLRYGYLRAVPAGGRR